MRQAAVPVERFILHWAEIANLMTLTAEAKRNRWSGRSLTIPLSFAIFLS